MLITLLNSGFLPPNLLIRGEIIGECQFGRGASDSPVVFKLRYEKFYSDINFDDCKIIIRKGKK